MSISSNFNTDMVSLAAFGVVSGVVSTCVFGGPLTIVGGAAVGGFMSFLYLINKTIFPEEEITRVSIVVASVFCAPPTLNKLCKGLDLTRIKLLNGFGQTMGVIIGVLALVILLSKVGSAVASFFSASPLRRLENK